MGAGRTVRSVFIDLTGTNIIAIAISQRHTIAIRSKQLEGVFDRRIQNGCGHGIGSGIGPDVLKAAAGDLTQRHDDGFAVVGDGVNYRGQIKCGGLAAGWHGHLNILGVIGAIGRGAGVGQLHGHGCQRCLGQAHRVVGRGVAFKHCRRPSDAYQHNFLVGFIWRIRCIRVAVIQDGGGDTVLGRIGLDALKAAASDLTEGHNDGLAIVGIHVINGCQIKCGSLAASRDDHAHFFGVVGAVGRRAGVGQLNGHICHRCLGQSHRVVGRGVAFNHCCWSSNAHQHDLLVGFIWRIRCIRVAVIQDGGGDTVLGRIGLDALKAAASDLTEGHNDGLAIVGIHVINGCQIKCGSLAASRDDHAHFFGVVGAVGRRAGVGQLNGHICHRCLGQSHRVVGRGVAFNHCCRSGNSHQHNLLIRFVWRIRCIRVAIVHDNCDRIDVGYRRKTGFIGEPAY